MELAEIRPFEPQMAEIDLFTMPDAVGVGELSVRKQKPYIAGHVTDGSSTFTFKVNNTDVTVPVDANGNWKWVVDRDIKTLYRAFYHIYNVDYIEIYLPQNPNLTSVQGMFNEFGYSGSAWVIQDAVCVIKKFDTSNVTNFDSFCNGPGFKEMNLDKFVSTSKGTNFNCAFNLQYATIIDLRPIDVSGVQSNAQYGSIGRNIWYNRRTETLHLGKFLDNPKTEGIGNTVFSGSVDKLKLITAESIRISISFAPCKLLTQESVANIFNAVAADGITLTFHATVYAMIEEQLEIEGSPIYEAYWNSDYDFNYASA